jgi:hypothetical protein
VDNYATSLFKSFCFLVACELQLQANKDFLEANRIESFNEPWARFLRRKANRYRNKARKLAPNVYDGQVVDENGVPKEDDT